MRLSRVAIQFKKEGLYHWLLQPLATRQPKTLGEITKLLNISHSTAFKWNKEYYKEKKEGTLSFNYNSVDWLNNRSREADEALIRAVEKGNSAALKLYYQLTGKYIEKAEYEHKFTISADELIKRALAANRRARELDDRRSPEVLEQPALLLDGICVDSGQDKQENSQMAAMAVSG